MGTEEKSYHCSHLEKTLHKSKLDRHMIQHKEKHTGEKTYYFNQCEESISEYDKFTKNIMTHTGYDPYQCDLCEKAFPRKKYLIQHKDKHTGEKPYHCNHCEESISQTIIL